MLSVLLLGAKSIKECESETTHRTKSWFTSMNESTVRFLRLNFKTF